MGRILSRGPVFDAGSTPPGSQVRRVNIGTAISPQYVIERLPPGAWRKIVDQHGNVKRVPVTLADRRDNPTREREIERRMQATGSVPYDACPLRTGGHLTEADFPEHLQAACEVWEVDPASGQRRARFGPERCCPHVDFVIQERQKARKEANAAYDAEANAEKIRRQRMDELLETAVLKIGGIDPDEVDKPRRGRPPKVRDDG